MDDISNGIGISKKTIYKFFANKKDLVQKVLYYHNQREKTAISKIQKESSNAIEEMIGITQHVTRELRKLRPTIVYDLKKYHKDLWAQIQSFHEEFVYEIIESNISHGIEEGLYRSSINAHVISKLYVQVSLILVDQDHFPEKEFEREFLYQEYIKYHLNGILSEEGHKIFNNYQSNATKK